MNLSQANVQPQVVAKPALAQFARGLLQRACDCGQHTTSSGDDCEECKMKRKGMLQRAGVNASPVKEVPLIVHEVLRSPGQPLDPATRAYMEPRFGYDFSNVRVHNNAQAAESARAINARAYTVGQGVVFGGNQYEPETNTGRRLIAHELTHVIQQTGGSKRVMPATSGMKIGEPNDNFEREADRVSNQISSKTDKSPHILAIKSPSIQRTCGSTAIKAKTSPSCGVGDHTFVAGNLFKFNKDCDDFAVGEEAALISFASALPPTTTLEIHSYASVDTATFNEQLSCARSTKAQAILTASPPSGAGIAGSRITSIINHGPTPGPAIERRSIVIRTAVPPTPRPMPPPSPVPTPAPTCYSFPCLGNDRCLTGPERSTAASVFGTSLDFNSIRISDSLGLGGAPWTNVSPITVWMRVGGIPIPIPVPVSYGTCLNLGTTFSNATLIHELVHSWQSQHHASPTKYMQNAAASQALSIGLYGDRGCAYRYIPGAPFGDYAAEQIAQMIEDHFTGTPGLGRYVSIIASAGMGTVSADNVASLSVPRIGPPPC